MLENFYTSYFILLSTHKKERHQVIEKTFFYKLYSRLKFRLYDTCSASKYIQIVKRSAILFWYIHLWIILKYITRQHTSKYKAQKNTRNSLMKINRITETTEQFITVHRIPVSKMQLRVLYHIFNSSDKDILSLSLYMSPILVVLKFPHQKTRQFHSKLYIE